MRRLVLPLLAALSVAACASEPTHYQPAAKPGAVGFSEMQIEPGRYRITFRGGPGAPPEQVTDYALLRAAELALAQGYDWFQVYDRRVGAVGGGDGPTIGLGIGGMNFGRHSAVGGSVGTGFDLGGGPELASTIEVVFGRGPKPPAPNAYDAHEVRRTIGARA
jgi:hypothetical protein